MIGLVFLCLDLMYRLDSVLRFHSPLELALNAVFPLGLMLLAVPCLAGLARGLEQLRAGLGLSMLWAVFVYLNAIYFRLWRLTQTPELGIDPTNTNRLTTLILVLALAAYPLVRRWSSLSGEQLARVGIGALRGLVPLCLVGLLASASRPPLAEASPARAERPHVLLISFDSLASSHMSLYGYERSTTPFLERWGKTSFVFEKMVSNTNYTHVTLVSLLGRLPRGTGTHPDGQNPLPLILKQAGYECHYFTHSFPPPSFRRGFDRVHLMQSFQFEPGYRWLASVFPSDHLEWLTDLLSHDQRFYNLWANRDPRDLGGYRFQPFPTGDYFNQAIELLAHARQPMFIWIHAWEPHNPYVVPRPWLYAFGPSLVDRYDGAVRYCDSLLQFLVSDLERLGLDQHTLLAVTSDHGEGHGERVTENFSGVFHNCNWVNPATSRIPLVIHLPGQTQGARIKTPCQTLDIPPTLAQLLHLPVPSDWEGESLVPYTIEPGLISQRVRVVTPVSFYLRRTKWMDRVPPHWYPDGSKEIFNAYLGPYRVVWQQRYRRQGRYARELESLEFLGLYRGEGPNLVHEPASQAWLEAFFQRPELAMFRDGLAGWKVSR